MCLRKAFNSIARHSLVLIVLAFLVSGACMNSPAFAATRRKPSVLLVHASPYAPEIQSTLAGSGVFSAVDLFNAKVATPSLTTLKNYDAVMLTSDAGFADATALGNNLADYVDAGGGVVNTAFSIGSVSPPAGRWNPSYLVMQFSTSQIGTHQTLDLASIPLPDHPILIGVAAFDGGSSSYRIVQNNVVAGATVIARWTGGNVLAAVGPLPGRVDLNIYPASSLSRSDFWLTSTDGLKLMVNSLLYVMRPRILMAGSENTTPDQGPDVIAKLRSTNIFGFIDRFNTSAATPTLTQLKNYDAVLVYSNYIYLNPDALGNVLADYVDSGGGVVSAHFNFTQFAANTLGGRWGSQGYSIIVPAGPTKTGPATLGSVAYPSHPIMSGVASFDGGSASFRTSSTTLNPGGFRIASWSTGEVLIAASTKRHNRADLGFFPLSSDTISWCWNSSTDGARLMANALLYTIKPYVGLVAADPYAAADVPGKLSASGRFSGVTYLDASGSTPSQASLMPFNAVLTWSNASFANASTLGNTLADFVDAGGAEVTAVFANSYGPGNRSPAGRWISQGYDVLPTASIPGYINTPEAYLGTIVEPDNPIATFVRKFDGGPNSFRNSSNVLLRGRPIMNWSDGRNLISVHNFRKRADLGYWPVSNSHTNGWNHLTDGTWMTANTLEYSVRHVPCPGDLNGDNQVDDSDFSLFVTAYDNLIDPRADFNGDGYTDDSDFSVFARSYDELLCP